MLRANSSVHFSCSVMSDSLQSHEPQHASITNSRSSTKLMSIESVMPSNHLILCCPLLLPPLVFPRISIFPNESVLLIRRPRYWSFSISPSSEYSGVISFRMDWFDLLAVQGTLKSLLQDAWTTRTCGTIPKSQTFMSFFSPRKSGGRVQFRK